MAIEILWIDGFDEISSQGEKYKGTSETDSSTKYTYSSKSGITAPFGYGRFCKIDSGYLSKTLVEGNYQTTFSAFHMWAGRDLESSPNWYIYFELWNDVPQSSPCYIKLKLNKATGNFDAILVSGSNELYTWQTPIRFGQWHHVSLMLHLDTIDGKARLAVDGQELDPYTGTTTTGSPTATRFRIRCYIINSYMTFLLDNWVVATGLDTDPLLPPTRVYGALMPNANVDVNWIPSANTNWQCVDEIPHNSDSDYNVAGVVGKQDVFSHATIPNPGTDVLAVKVNCISRKDGSSTESIQPLVRVSSTDYYGTAQQETTSYFSYGHLWQNNPATGLPWTPTEAQSAGFGYRR